MRSCRYDSACGDGAGRTPHSREAREGKVRREWLEKDDSNPIHGFDAAYAEKTQAGVVRLGASEDGNRVAFRVVLTAFKASHGMIPRKATRSMGREVE